MYESFVSLLPELQVEIISKRPELIHIFTKVNKYYNNLLAQALYDEVKDKNTTQYELDMINAMMPVRATLNCYKKDRFKYVLMNIYIKNTIATTIQTKISINIDNNSVRIENSAPIMNVNQINSIKDCLTIYYTRNARLNCKKINPMYAKEETLNCVDEYIFKLKDKLKDSDFKNEFLIEIYTYAINCKIVLNIVDNSDINKLNNIHQNFEEIQSDILSLYDKIKQKILDL